jgi:diguanylate cyclase (GGDEF)-like protein
MLEPLKRRLLWSGGPADVVDDRVLMARAAAYLWGGATVLSLGALLLPEQPGRDVAGMFAVSCACAAVTAALLVWFDRVPAWAYHVSSVLGTLLTLAALHFSGLIGGPATMFFLWVGLFGFYFYGRGAALLHVALMGAGYALLLALENPSFPPVAYWLSTIGSLVAGGLIVNFQRTRAGRLIERLESAARTDPLTRLLNRRGLEELFERELERTRRGQGELSVLVCDLDHFKQVNDRLGHLAGDRVLERLGRVLKLAARRADGAARLGGEEFALLLPGCGLDEAHIVAERLRREVRTEFASDPLPLTISFGVAAMPNHGDSTWSLLQAADHALYAAKELGRDRTVIYGSDATTALAGRRAGAGSRDSAGSSLLAPIEAQRAEIQDLLSRPRELRPVFQPLVALATGHVAGYEALTRFGDGRSPDAWFEQARRVGLGAALEAATAAEALAVSGRPEGAFLSLNLSPSVLASVQAQAVLPRDLSGIVVEVTEQELVADDLQLEARLGKLRERGARIAVDDAGVGYAGLQQVMRVQPDIIKLDRALIQGVDSDPAKVALVESFVRFARRTGAAVCAEGVETLEELTMLANLDVTYGQGYALARPAAPWAAVEPEAAKACRLSFAAAMLAGAGEEDMADTGDRRLERLSGELSRVNSFADLEGRMALIAAELEADAVYFSEWDESRGAVATVSAHGWLKTGELFRVEDYPSTRHVLESQEAVQILVGDPASDPSEVSVMQLGGWCSLLMVPVVAHGRTLGLLEIFSCEKRPWSRMDMNRARIISYQLGAVLESLSRRQVA